MLACGSESWTDGGVLNSTSKQVDAQAEDLQGDEELDVDKRVAYEPIIAISEITYAHIILSISIE